MSLPLAVVKPLIKGSDKDLAIFTDFFAVAKTIDALVAQHVILNRESRRILDAIKASLADNQHCVGPSHYLST